MRCWLSSVWTLFSGHIGFISVARTMVRVWPRRLVPVLLRSSSERCKSRALRSRERSHNSCVVQFVAVAGYPYRSSHRNSRDLFLSPTPPATVSFALCMSHVRGEICFWHWHLLDIWCHIFFFLPLTTVVICFCVLKRFLKDTYFGGISTQGWNCVSNCYRTNSFVMHERRGGWQKVEEWIST